MHGGPHYSIRRLASTHPFEDPQEHVEEVTHHNAEPLHDALTCRFFMRPPDEAPTIKYDAVVRDILEEVDLLHVSLISMQNSRPLQEVLELTNSCRQVVSRLSDIVSDPILFAGSFTEYYIHFLREFLVDEDRAIENVRYALAGGIPSIVQACEKEREKIIEAKHVFRAASAELCKFLYTHDGTDTRIATNHPFTLKNVQALNLVLHKFDLMDQFCRSYEEYFGHEQFHHLHNLLHDFKFDLISRPSPREYDAMIQVWTRFERFTLHFPNELDTMTEFFKFNSAEGYTVRSTGLTPTSGESRSVYSESLPSQRGCKSLVHRCRLPRDGLGFLKRKSKGVKSWIYSKTWRFYRRIHLWLHKKNSLD